MSRVSVSTPPPAPIRGRGRPRIYVSSVEQTAALRSRQRAKGMVMAWVRLDVLEASRAEDKAAADKQAAKVARTKGAK